MNKTTARIVVIAIASWLIGAIEGSAISHSTSSVTRFEPGRYLFEEPQLGWVWAADFENPFYVSKLPPPRTESR